MLKYFQALFVKSQQPQPDPFSRALGAVQRKGLIMEAKHALKLTP
jgi:hypothetical protein